MGEQSSTAGCLEPERFAQRVGRKGDQKQATPAAEMPRRRALDLLGEREVNEPVAVIVGGTFIAAAALGFPPFLFVNDLVDNLRHVGLPTYRARSVGDVVSARKSHSYAC
jgi:hypothetical protein